MHRRSFVLLGAAGLGSMISGCSDDEGFDLKNAPSGPIVLGFSQVGSESGWRLANTKSIQKAAEYNRIELKFDNAEGDQKRQIAAIQSYIDARVNVIAFSPVVESGWDEVLQRARAAGIPVVLTDRLIKTADESLYVSSIGADFVAEGNLAAAYLANDYSSGKNSVKVVEILGTPDSTPAKQRTQGFTETISKEKKLTVIDREAGNWTKAGGETAMRKLLRRNKDFDAVFAQNDEMGLGAAAVLADAGREPGSTSRIVTVDATKAGLQGLIDGKLNYVVECSPLIGELLMKAVVDLFYGGKVLRRISSEIVVFDKFSAATALPDRTY
ncbi:ABC transporter substrate-binding protein [Actinoplanes sp. GCM10030250]|uniref:ABC transporter substrate-binding protein n=1 Tax=Actinoplanes sp. GCM10030250 TaxID=3273376 RepID=UPI00360E6CA4